MSDAWRYRRTAYTSGRREVIGAEKTRFGSPKRRTKKKQTPVAKVGTSKHRWRMH